MTEHSKEVMERRQTDFESWWARYAFLSDHEVRQKRQGDSYCGVMVASAWCSWNAALDSVEIELPAKFNGDHGGCIHEAGVHDDVIDECREAIESTGLGLRVKA